MTRTKRTTPTRRIDTLRKAALAKVAAVRATAIEGAGIARAKAAATFTRLDNAFQQRVAMAAARIGVPTAKEVRALARQVAELEARVAKLRRARA